MILEQIDASILSLPYLIAENDALRMDIVFGSVQILTHRVEIEDLAAKNDKCSI